MENKIEEMRKYEARLDISGEIKTLEEKVLDLKKTYTIISPVGSVQLARHPERPYTLDYIYMMTDNFIELHGDRLFKDDKAIVGGFAKLDDQKVRSSVIKKDAIQNPIYRNFGMSNPEGYRKALRLMKMAEKFKIPVISMIDTPGHIPDLKLKNVDKRKQ